ncbi:hypothetical protein L2E82_13948 [Cichorium intybus]|uniref:Uncharacterized protein n=1 Tax=Cichorium intybus TaxID=13427 RepID=A0ACB9EYP6_CICIN|nr:hypothetical protein L1887_33584 [Cichorium endivia]KAI3763950.1 hypothetical protein L2E82_13948 [Cichorium intybus]
MFEEKMKLFARQDVLPKKVIDIITNSERPKKKRKMQERAPIMSNQVTQRLKQFITNEINGKEAKLVIQKKLYASDLKKSQNRLNMPMKQVETHDFLTENEKRDLKNKKELEVPLLGPRLQMHNEPMVLKIWHMNSTDNYVLKTNWNNFVKKNEEDLKKDRMIQVWSFRREEQLRFAIACLERVDGQNDDALQHPAVLN